MSTTLMAISTHTDEAFGIRRAALKNAAKEVDIHLVTATRGDRKARLRP